MNERSTLPSPPHDWQDDGVSPHNGEYWFKCARCGATDWIASYGTADQLMPRECRPINQPRTDGGSNG